MALPLLNTNFHSFSLTMLLSSPENGPPSSVSSEAPLVVSDVVSPIHADMNLLASLPQAPLVPNPHDFLSPDCYTTPQDHGDKESSASANAASVYSPEYISL